MPEKKAHELLHKHKIAIADVADRKVTMRHLRHVDEPGPRPQRNGKERRNEQRKEQPACVPGQDAHRYSRVLRTAMRSR